MDDLAATAHDAATAPDAPRKSWSEICQQDELQGRWVALDGAVYDESADRPSSGLVIDADDDPAELCHRLRDSEHKNCSVHFVDQA